MPTISKVLAPFTLSVDPRASSVFQQTCALTSALPSPAAGYVVLEDFATQDEVRQLRERAQAIMDARLNNGAAAEEDAAIFSTVNQVARDVDPGFWLLIHGAVAPAAGSWTWTVVALSMLQGHVACC